MVTLTVALDIEYAYEMDFGEQGSVLQYFVRGGHYHHAFWLAMQREAADNWRRITCTEHELMQHVQWIYWMEVPGDDGSWEYRNTTIDKGYPVTVMDKADLERLSVPVCRSCMNDDHDNCDRRDDLPVRLSQVGSHHPRDRRHIRWASRNAPW